MNSVRLRHPITGGEWMCPVGAVGAWLEKGWVKADAVPTAQENNEAPAVPAVAKPETTGKGK